MRMPLARQPGGVGAYEDLALPEARPYPRSGPARDPVLPETQPCPRSGPALPETETGTLVGPSVWGAQRTGGPGSPVLAVRINLGPELSALPRLDAAMALA